MTVTIRFTHSYWRAETVALLARMDSEPTRAQGNRIDTLLGGLIDNGFLARMDSLYVPVRGHSAAARLLDWVRPGVSATLAGSATTTEADGFVGSAITGSCINTNFTPSADAVVFTPNLAGIGAYLGATANCMLWGAYDAVPNNTATLCQMNTTTGVFPTAYMNGQVSSLDQLVSGAGTLGTGLIQHNRTAANQQALYRNGVSIGTKSYNSASRALCSQPIYLCAYNANGTVSTNGAAKVAAWWAGDAFTDAEQATLKSLFDTFMA